MVILVGQHLLRRVKVPELIYDQSFEFCISISLLIMGVRSLVGHASLVDGGVPAPALVVLDVWIFTVFVGSLAIVVSFLLHPYAVARSLADVTRLRVLEQAGLIFLATSALAYSVFAVASAGANGLYTLAIMSGVTVACVLRIGALRRADLHTLYRLRLINERINYDQGEC